MQKIISIQYLLVLVIVLLVVCIQTLNFKIKMKLSLLKHIANVLLCHDLDKALVFNMTGLHER